MQHPVCESGRKWAGPGTRAEWGWKERTAGSWGWGGDQA